MANVFNSVQVPRVPSNWFDMSHDVKLSGDMGLLIPTLVQEILPGDIWKGRAETLIRFAPMIAPVMHNVSVYQHYFFVPNRLVWANWEKFITANNGAPTVPAAPVFSSTGAGIQVGQLGDYLGLPTNVPIGLFNALPFAAYQCIYNEYYRDQNLIPEVNYKLVDGTNSTFSSWNTIRRRAWQHDYFTSSLPFAQKGQPVSLPLGSFNDVPVKRQTNNPGLVQAWSNNMIGSGTTSVYDGTPNQNVGANFLYAETSGLVANAATINDLRRAFRLQEWLEKMARGGSRYIEQTLMHFGVQSSDARLQRPEFIGGTRAPVIISEVLQTSSSDTTSPQGTMAGHALAANMGKNFSYKSEEHGFIIGIMSIMPMTAYSQGLDKLWSRSSYLDYAWPTFAHIGEQQVLNKEVYCDGTAADNNTFGYVPRYAEYRYMNSRIAGSFRTTEKYWHFGRSFATRPALNQQFIECTPTNDPFAVTTGQKLWCHVFNNFKMLRKLPKYGTPSF